jgi:hypothetical protein
VRAGRALAAVAALLTLLPVAPAAEDGGVPVDPYVDPAQLADRPSFRLQPWRGWMDTVAADGMLDGIGVQYRVPAGTDHAATIAVLADTGVRRLRVEVPWTDAEPGGGLTEAGGNRLSAILDAAAANDVAPLILLNANSAGPTPHVTTEAEVAAPAPAGSHEVRLASVDGLVAGRSGISGMTRDVMAGVLMTGVDEGTGTVTLGRPLPADLATGDTVTVDTLAYAPLHAAGTPAFDRTADGWLDYVRAVLDEAGRHDVDGVQVEIWNETAFASTFLDVANYDDGEPAEGEAKFRPGGRAWELARRTVDTVHAEYPDVRVVWGFSNSNFYATPVRDLPPGTDAVSYHPYGTGLLEVPEEFPGSSQVGTYDEVPDDLRLAVPEGRTALAASPQPLVRRRLAPDRRDEHPPGTDAFRQVITEHGCTPREVGIADEASAMRHKARCLLRYLPFWLNKGIAELYVSRAWDADPLGRGVLSPDVSPADAGVDPDDLVAPPLAALHNFTSTFDGAEDLTVVRQLGVDVTALGEQRQVFRGDDGQQGLWERDLLAVLPFQVTPSRFVVAAYVLTYDLTQPIEAEPYRLTFTGVHPEEAEVRWYDPLTDEDEPVDDLVRGADGSITVTVDVGDTARLLVIDEDPSDDRSLPGWAVPAGLAALAAVAVALAVAFLHRPPAGPSPWPGEPRTNPRRRRGRRRDPRPF